MNRGNALKKIEWFRIIGCTLSSGSTLMNKYRAPKAGIRTVIAEDIQIYLGRILGIVEVPQAIRIAPKTAMAGGIYRDTFTKGKGQMGNLSA